jgi:DNA-binding beta-propeller fold protein YncE
MLTIARPMVRRARSVLAAVSAGCSRAGRVIWRPVDRIRYPWAPKAVVQLDSQSPSSAAYFGSPLFVGRERFATASDATWLDNNTFAVCYLLTSSIAVFKVDDSQVVPSCELVSADSDPTAFGTPECVESLSGGSLIAMTESTAGRLVLLANSTDGDRGLEFVGSVSLPNDRTAHGLAVSSDDRFIVYTSADDPGGLRVVEVVDGSRLELVHVAANDHASLKPKGLNFTPDGRHLIVAYAFNASSSRKRVTPGFVEVVEFDPASGAIGRAISRSPRSLKLGVPDWVWVNRAGTQVFVSDQPRDRVSAYGFNAETGEIGGLIRRISWAAGGLSFPHGCGVSPDGRWIAVTNYGDGSVRLFDLA